MRRPTGGSRSWSSRSSRRGVADQALRDRLLTLPGYTPSADTLELVRRFHAEATIFRAENVPIQSDLMKLENQFDKIIGGLAIDWEGATETIPQARLHWLSPHRRTREGVAPDMAAFLGQREKLNGLYLDMLGKRRQVARNAGLPDFRAYKWSELARFDYTPADCLTFHDAIEHEVVPLRAQALRTAGGRPGLRRCGRGTSMSTRTASRCGRSATWRSWKRAATASSARSIPNWPPTLR